MISATHRAIMAIVLTVCASGLWLSWRARGDARGDLEAATAVAQHTAQEIRDLETLRARAASVDQQERPAETLVAPLKSILTAHGIRAEMLTAVSLPDPQPINDTSLARQSASLTLTGIRTTELASVLAEWAASQPLWTVKAIRMDRNAGPARQSDELDRFTAVVTLDNIHVRGTQRNGSRP